MTSKLNKTTVQNVAHLARLDISDSDIDKYVKDLSNILNIVDEMNQIDTKGIAPMSHPLELTQPTRPDEAKEPNKRDTYLENAPNKEAGLFLVPKVIE